MLFWILLGLVVVLTIIIFSASGSSYSWGFDWPIALLSGFATLLIGGLVSVLIIGVISIWVPREYIGETHHEDKLRALSASSETGGRFAGIFATTGYVDEEPVFRFIRAEGKGFVLDSIEADRTILYEGDYTPKVVTTVYEYGTPWLTPWTGTETAYELYVPKGSVSDEIAVAP